MAGSLPQAFHTTPIKVILVSCGFLWDCYGTVQLFIFNTLGLGFGDGSVEA